MSDREQGKSRREFCGWIGRGIGLLALGGLMAKVGWRGDTAAEPSLCARCPALRNCSRPEALPARDRVGGGGAASAGEPLCRDETKRSLLRRFSRDDRTISQ